MIELSPREAQVMQMIADGYTTDFIAYQLGITAHKVRDYVDVVLHELDVHCREEAVAILVKLDMVHKDVTIYLGIKEDINSP